MTKFKTHRKKFRLLYQGILGPKPTPKKWCFLVGCYNSGTTLLHRVLADHPEIATMPDEGQFYTDVLPLPMELGLPRLWAVKPELFYLDDKSSEKLNVKRLKKQWGANINDLKRPVVVEKSPTNAARILWLEKHFEDAHFIGIIRNGYAVSEGIRRKARHSLSQTAEQWKTSNEILLRDLPKTKNNMLIRYEDFTADPKAATQSMLSFLGLGHEYLDKVEKGEWAIHEQKSEIKNMNSRSFESLSESEVAEIEMIAGEMLEKNGYTPFGS